jgi:general L-amino acid transport system permease protein
MASLSEPTHPTLVYSDVPLRPPPRRARGIWAWMRANLFKSTFDTVVTFITTAFLIWVISGLFTWTITQANWLIVTRNLRVFMVGLFPIDDVWRVNLGALLVSFAVGFTFAAYVVIRWRRLILPLIVLALMIVIPPITHALTPPTDAYFAAGSVAVVSGSETEMPQEQVAFLGRAGETVRVELAAQGHSDETLITLQGFTDRAGAALFNAAANRFAAQDELASLETALAGDLLTDAQRADLTEERDGLTIPPSPSETYTLNSTAVRASILDGRTLDVLATITLDPNAEPVFDEDGSEVMTQVMIFPLPADGWYVLEKVLVDEDAEANVLLRTTGIVPVLERNLTSSDEYVRITDDFTVADFRPENDGRDIPFISLTENAYRGSRTFADFMRLYTAPMLEMLARALVPMTLLASLGVLMQMAIVRLRPAPPRGASPAAASRALVFPLWTVVLIVFFILIYGIDGLTPLKLGSLVASFIWVGWMFFAGMTLNRVWGRPLLGALLVLGAAQIAVAHNVTSGIVLVDVAIALIIWTIVGLMAARQGAGMRHRFTPRQQVTGLAISGGLWLAAFILIPLLAGAGNGDDLLPIVETRRWGGLLLTMVLTVVALLASFPFGILLALGRRSSLPVVKWVCTVYIELVRGVPLITVLFLASLLVPLVNPALATVENAIRAMVGLTLFSAAYLAENVRGGLQSVAAGQEEAARALGLSSTQIILLITLPQALRAVIPALVGQCIALFKDTSLVALVGLLDLTGIAKAVTSQAEFVGLQTEAYVFISVIYFIFSYVMAYVSRRIEASGSGVVRRFG